MCDACYGEYHPAYVKGRLEFRRRRSVRFQAILLAVEVRGAERAIAALAKMVGGPLSRISSAGVFIMALTIALALYAILMRLVNPGIIELARSLWSKAPAGYGLVGVPGLDPMLPLLQGWIAVVIALTVHEFGHGIVATRLGYTVKSMSLLFVGPILLGALVSVDGRRGKDLYRVVGAGPTSNIIAALAALAALLLLNGWAWSPMLLMVPPELARLRGVDVRLELWASILFYVWFMNLLFALANAAPMLVTDGSYLLLLTLERLGVRRARLAAKLASFAFVGALLAVALLERLPPP
ncbi:MAG: site-2 protease family protein [Thermosphaera sp.]